MRRMRSRLPVLLLVSASIPALGLACGPKEGDSKYPTPVGSAGAAGDGGVSGDPLDVAIAAAAAKSVPDMRVEMAPPKFSLMRDGHQKIELNLAAGKCYAIIGAGPADGDLDMVVQANGQTVAQDQTHEPTVVLGAPPMVLCPPQNGTLALDVSVKNAGGNVGVALYSKALAGGVAQPTATGSVGPVPTATGSASVGPVPTATATSLSTEDPMDVLLRANVQKLAKGMDLDGPPTKAALQEGGKTNVVVTLQPGRCYGIVAVASPGGIADIDMQLMMPPFFTVQVGKDTRTDNVALIGGTASPLCPAAMFPVPYRLDVTAKKGSGAIAIQVLSKTK